MYLIFLAAASAAMASGSDNNSWIYDQSSPSLVFLLRVMQKYCVRDKIYKESRSKNKNI